MASVGKLLSAAFMEARQKHSGLHEIWVRMSFQVGSRLPASSLAVSIQRDGELDLILRCMEDEIASSEEELQREFFAFHHLNMMSEYWIGAIYETFRVVKSRELWNAPRISEIAKDLELIRMPLEKHEIPKDYLLKKQPLEMVRIPSKGDGTDEYTYDYGDGKRAHILPKGLSARGSLTWHVIDLREETSRWIERRSISDSIIEMSKQIAQQAV